MSMRSILSVNLLVLNGAVDALILFLWWCAKL